MTAREEFINKLENLKTGELGLLRSHAGQGLDESVSGFDLFSGLWWPLRKKKDSDVPRREVAWLIAKLYAFRPIPQSPGDGLASQLGKHWRQLDGRNKERFEQKFDELLQLSLDQMEYPLQWAISQLESRNTKLDWIKLTKDLLWWERESTRLEWAKDFLGNNGRRQQC